MGAAATSGIRPSSPRKRGPSDCGKTTLGPGSRPLRGLGRDGCARLGTRTAGFSLLEVLVAFVILALVGTALFRLFSGALGNATLSDEYSRATLYAESRLVGLGVETPLREGVQQGTSEDGYYAWTAKVERYTPPGTTPDIDSTVGAMGVSLWRLATTVRWPGAPGSERSISLATLKVAIKEPTP
jgi:general secretion pathway protein I